MAVEPNIGSPTSLRQAEAVRTKASTDGAAALRRLAGIAAELGAERPAADAGALAERIAEGRFYVACVGQFKRGKSTLLGALIGDQVLPTGIVPVTTVPTVVRYGPRGAHIRSRDGGWRDIQLSEVEQYVSEERNPENTKGVEGVEVFVPSPLLSSGMCLVDTPGLGSVFAGNSAATQAFIPHIDAAIAVIGADPPISGDELALVEAVGKQVPDILVVLNKADRVTDEERSASAAFARKMLEARLQRPIGPIYQVSALEHLEDRGPGRDWPQLIAALQELIQNSGRTLIHSATERGIERVTRHLLAIVAQQRAALLRPIEESEQRISAMRSTLQDADRSLREIGFLLTGEQQHLATVFVDRRKSFVAATLPLGEKELAAAVASAPRTAGPAYRRHLMQQAQDIVRRHVAPWLEAEQAAAEDAYRDTARRFVEIGMDFLCRLADAGIPEVLDMAEGLDAEQGFRARSQFFFHEMIHLARPASPFRYLADVGLGALGAYGGIVRDAREFLEHLLEVNSARVQSDLNNRVQESRGRLEIDVRIVLHEVTHVAEAALENARQARAAGETAVQSRLARLASLEAEVQAFRGTQGMT